MSDEETKNAKTDETDWVREAEEQRRREEALEEKYERIGWTGGLDE